MVNSSQRVHGSSDVGIPAVLWISSADMWIHLWWAPPVKGRVGYVSGSLSVSHVYDSIVNLILVIVCAFSV
jgi:hypothetical protein